MAGSYVFFYDPNLFEVLLSIPESRQYRSWAVSTARADFI